MIILVVPCFLVLDMLVLALDLLVVAEDVVEAEEVAVEAAVAADFGSKASSLSLYYS
jgi:hypothetical protein